VVIMPSTFGMGIDPSMRKRDRNPTLFGTGKWNRVLIDATINLDYDPDPDYGGARFPPTVWPQADDIAKAYARWSELGLGKPKGESPYEDGGHPHDRTSRHLRVRRPQALRHSARAARAQTVGAARRFPSAARLRQQQDVLKHHGADQGAERFGLRGAALRHARLRRQRRRIRPRDLPRAGRGHAQRTHLPRPAPGGRSRAHRAHRIEFWRGGRALYRPRP